MKVAGENWQGDGKLKGARDLAWETKINYQSPTTGEEAGDAGWLGEATNNMEGRRKK